jgi:hypothetical protein
VPVKGEVHLLDAVAFGADAETRFGPWGTAAEQNALGWIHASAFSFKPSSLQAFKPSDLPA